MTDLLRPRFPIYIPSKGRADIALTPRILDEMKVPYRIVVEPDEVAAYQARWGADRIIELDMGYKDAYPSLDPDGDEQGVSKGSGPARNFIWDHAVAEGHAWHWIMDDNIELFARLHQNQRIPVQDGMIFHAMETFALRYENVGMVGPEYWTFRQSRDGTPTPFVVNRRLFSCNMIRCDVPLRWRGRYNEDLILSIDMLKAKWATIRFYAFIQKKTATQQMRGGNTDAFYATEGTLAKSKLAVREHPDIVELAWRYNRWHHDADFRVFDGNPRLVRRPDWRPEDDPVYRFRRVSRTPRGTPRAVGHGERV